MSVSLASFLQYTFDTISKASTVDAAKTRLSAIIKVLADGRQPEELISSLRVRGRNFYDQLITDILESVRIGVSREELLNLVMQRFADQTSDSVALGYMALSGQVSDDGRSITGVNITQFERFHPQRIENFLKKGGLQLASSGLVQRLLLDKDSIDFIPTELTREYLYFGEFDDLIGRNKSGAWINAVPLPSIDVRQPNRAIIAFYPAAGLADQPSLPRGAGQEARVFGFLRGAYDLLNHQLESLADQVLLQRREILADLGPGLVNHEINQQIQILRDAVNVMNLKTRALHKLVGENEDLLDLIEGLKLAYGGIDRLSTIADAFNNLERRQARASVTIGQLVREVGTLLHYRFTRYGIYLEFLCEQGDVLVETDAALFEHVLMNIVTNAVDAFREEDSLQLPSAINAVRQIRVRVFPESDSMVEIVVENNGPPILLERKERIFEKGITTKGYGVGHGLGLYICRLVMTFLGGEIRLIPEAALAPPFAVGFQIRLPRQLERSDEMMSASSGRMEWKGGGAR